MKLKFFVIHGNTAFEYTEEEDYAVQWLGERIENVAPSEKEYFEKRFPLDVAERMVKESRRKRIDEMLGEENR